jgi:UDP-glucose 4-epimerase
VTPIDRRATGGAVLVTGAGGFIGAHVVSLLLERGYEVVALTRRKSLPDHLAERCRRIVTGDIADSSDLGDALDGARFVCHLAAHIPSDHSDPAEARRCLEVNALATLQLALSSLERGVEAFAYASAGNAYAPTDAPASEDFPPWPTSRATWYLSSKVLAEQYLEHLSLRDRLRAFNLRISSPYGPGMSEAAVVARFLAQAKKGEPIKVLHGGIPSVDHVHVSDVAKCFVSALSSDEPGAYNVGSGRQTTLLELAEAVTLVAGSPAPVDVRPATGPLPPSFSPISIERARRDLGLEPIDLETGLQSMLEA